MFRGDRVLDAGCGAGQWSLALAQRFQQVDAVDLKRERLAVLEAVAERMGVRNVKAYPGPLEQLACEDAALDAVFCYGVLMLVDAGACSARSIACSGPAAACTRASTPTAGVAASPRKRASTIRRRARPGFRRSIPRIGSGPSGRAFAKPWPKRPSTIPRGFSLGRIASCSKSSAASRGSPGGRWPRWAASNGGGRRPRLPLPLGRWAGMFRRVQGFCGDDFVPLLLDDVSTLLNQSSQSREGEAPAEPCEDVRFSRFTSGSAGASPSRDDAGQSGIAQSFQPLRRDPGLSPRGIRPDRPGGRLRRFPMGDGRGPGLRLAQVARPHPLPLSRHGRGEILAGRRPRATSQTSEVFETSEVLECLHHKPSTPATGATSFACGSASWSSPTARRRPSCWIGTTERRRRRRPRGCTARPPPNRSSRTRASRPSRLPWWLMPSTTARPSAATPT